MVQNISFNGTNIGPQAQITLLENALKKHELTNKTFGSVSVSHSNNLSTLVPKALFNKDNLTEYLKYNLKVLPNDFIAYDPVANAELVNVYIPYIHYNNFLFDTYGSFEYKHSSTVLIELLLAEYKNSIGTHFFVNVEDHIFQIVVLKNKKLEFFNTFSFKTKEDFIYYILFASEQLQLNPEEFQLTFLGDVEKEGDLYKTAYKYIRNINFFKSDKQLDSTHSNHAFSTLINQQ